MQFYYKDPEFVQIICFDIALQESYYHWLQIWTAATN